MRKTRLSWKAVSNRHRPNCTIQFDLFCINDTAVADSCFQSAWLAGITSRVARNANFLIHFMYSRINRINTTAEHLSQFEISVLCY